MRVCAWLSNNAEKRQGIFLQLLMRQMSLMFSSQPEVSLSSSSLLKLEGHVKV